MRPSPHECVFQRTLETARKALTLQALTSKSIIFVVVVHRVRGLDRKCVQVFIVSDVERLAVENGMVEGCGDRHEYRYETSRAGVFIYSRYAFSFMCGGAVCWASHTRMVIIFRGFVGCSAYATESVTS